MKAQCHKCQNEVELSTNDKVDFRAVCKKCSSYLHCCLNCKFYSKTAYNQCTETQAERVADKTKSNFCDFFAFTNKLGQNMKDDPLKKLEDLFK